MKKTNFFFLLLAAITLQAQDLAVKQLWNRSGPVRPGQLAAAGFVQDGERVVLALQIAGLKNIMHNGSVSIYWDCDNNSRTGRTKARGADLQINIRFRNKQYDVIHWENNSRSDLAVNSTSGLHFDGNLLILDLPASLLEVVKLTPGFRWRVSLINGGTRPDSIYTKMPEKNFNSPVLYRFTPEKVTSSTVAHPVSSRGIAVPARLERNGIIRAAGVYRDNEKIVFGFVMPKISKGDSLLLYWNSDNDVNTGRFPGRLGVDIQFIMKLYEKTLKVVVYEVHPHKKELTDVPLTVYEDDFLIEEKDGVLFVAFKNATMAKVKFSPASFTEVVCNTNNGRERFILKFDLDAPCKRFLPQNLDFIRFGSQQKMRDKTARAIPLRSAAPGFRIWDCGGERFSENEAAPRFAAPAAAFSMKAAKNESERLFFAVEQNSAFQSMDVTAGNFRTASGKTIAAENFTVRYADMVINDRNEKITDILLPAFPGRPVKRQFVMLEVKVPADAAAGIYSGSLALNANGKKIQDIPVRLEVFNFTLPEKSAMTTAYALKRSRVSEKFRNRRTAEAIVAKLHDQAYRFRYSVRLMGNEPRVSVDKQGKLHLDWRKYEQEKNEFHKRFSISQHTLFQLGSHDNFIRWDKPLNRDIKNTNDPLFKSVWEQFVKASYAYHKEKGFIDKTLFIIWDEPYSGWDDIINAAKTIRTHAPDMPIGIFINRYQPQLEKYIDIWLVTAPSIAYMRTSPGMKEKRVWLYNTVGMRNFKRPAADLRGYYLLAYKYNIEGFLYSAINCLFYTKYDGKYYYNNYPNHTWMYADETGTRVFDSWRQHLTADGLDDYDYLHIYDSLLKKQGKSLPAWVTAKFPGFNQNDGSVVFNINTIAEWNVIREKIAREIEKLQ